MYIYHCCEKKFCIQLKITCLILKTQREPITLAWHDWFIFSDSFLIFASVNSSAPPVDNEWLNSSKARQGTCPRTTVSQGPKAVSLMLPNSHCNFICVITTHHLQMFFPTGQIIPCDFAWSKWLLKYKNFVDYNFTSVVFLNTACTVNASFYLYLTKKWQNSFHCYEEKKSKWMRRHIRQPQRVTLC